MRFKHSALARTNTQSEIRERPRFVKFRLGVCGGGFVNHNYSPLKGIYYRSPTADNLSFGEMPFEVICRQAVTIPDAMDTDTNSNEP